MFVPNSIRCASSSATVCDFTARRSNPTPPFWSKLSAVPPPNAAMYRPCFPAVSPTTAVTSRNDPPRSPDEMAAVLLVVPREVRPAAAERQPERRACHQDARHRVPRKTRVSAAPGGTAGRATAKTASYFLALWATNLSVSARGQEKV